MKYSFFIFILFCSCGEIEKKEIFEKKPERLFPEILTSNEIHYKFCELAIIDISDDMEDKHFYSCGNNLVINNKKLYAIDVDTSNEIYNRVKRRGYSLNSLNSKGEKLYLLGLESYVSYFGRIDFVLFSQKGKYLGEVFSISSGADAGYARSLVEFRNDTISIHQITNAEDLMNYKYILRNAYIFNDRLKIDTIINKKMKLDEMSLQLEILQKLKNRRH